MDWIIRSTEKLKSHTNLTELLKPLADDLDKFNWLFSDLEFISSKEIPLSYEKDYFILGAGELREIANSYTQIVWGVISAIPKGMQVEINKNDLPSAEKNEIWRNGNHQIKNSAMEIIAFDSSYTIIKFTDRLLSKKFSQYFDEAIELEKFKGK